MVPRAPTDEELLTGGDPASFEQFYARHVDAILGFFARRTRDAESFRQSQSQVAATFLRALERGQRNL